MDLTLRATKMMEQSICHAMGSMVVLDMNLWLMLMDMRDAEKVVLLNTSSVPLGFLAARLNTPQNKSLKHKSNKG